MSSTAEKVKAAREYAEHHGIKPWTEHIFNVLDALEESEKFNREGVEYFESKRMPGNEVNGWWISQILHVFKRPEA